MYYGPNTSTFKTVGTVFTDELVVALREANGWTYIEYDSVAGRKRGYVPTWKLHYHDTSLSLDSTFPAMGGTDDDNDGYYHTVYAGPSVHYHEVGYISGTEPITLFGSSSITIGSDDWIYIEYSTPTGEKKSGWIN